MIAYDKALQDCLEIFGPDYGYAVGRRHERWAVYGGLLGTTCPSLYWVGFFEDREKAEEARGELLRLRDEHVKTHGHEWNPGSLSLVVMS